MHLKEVETQQEGKGKLRLMSLVKKAPVSKELKASGNILNFGKVDNLIFFRLLLLLNVHMYIFNKYVFFGRQLHTKQMKNNTKSLHTRRNKKNTSSPFLAVTSRIVRDVAITSTCLANLVLYRSCCLPFLLCLLCGVVVRVAN